MAGAERATPTASSIPQPGQSSEIVGYWTPEYLADKLSRLSAVRGVNLIVAVPRHPALRAAELSATMLPFKRRLLLRDLPPRLEAFRPT